MPSLREFAKQTLPDPAVNWIRRWMATIRYVRFMSQNVFWLKSRLEPGSSAGTVETPMADPFYQLIVREVLERTDVVLQQLDQKIEAQGLRHRGRLESLEGEIARLRLAVDELRDRLPAPD